MVKVARDKHMDLTEYLQRFNKGKALEHLEISEVVAGAKAGKQDAMEALLVRNIGLVLGEARRYSQDPAVLPDYMEEGFMGIMRAVRTFDPALGHQFSTYAIGWIRHYISAMHMSLSSAVYVPINTRKQVRKAHAIFQKHRDASGDDTLATQNTGVEMDIPVARVQSLLTIGRVALSTDDRGEEGEGATLGERLPDDQRLSPEEKASEDECNDKLNRVLALLNDKERSIVTRHFFQGVSLAELGREANQSRQQIQAVASRALAKMKSSMAQLGVSQYAC